MSLIHLIERVDHRVITRLHGRLRPSVVAGFKAASRTGDGHVQVACILWAWWLASESSIRFFDAAIMAFCIERSLYSIAKRRFRRRRPSAALPSFVALVTPSDEFSFPSGHTMAAFLLATLLYLTFDMPAVGVFTWAMLVGCSRVVLGVHFPSDIVVGAVLGVAIAFVGVGLV